MVYLLENYFFNCNTVTIETLLSLFLIHIQGCTLWISDAVGSVECPKVNTIIADAQLDTDDSPQQLSMLARVERRQREFVPTRLLAPVAYLPDKVIVGLKAKPRFQQSADAETAVLPLQEVPCVLQP